MSHEYWDEDNRYIMPDRDEVKIYEPLPTKMFPAEVPTSSLPISLQRHISRKDMSIFLDESETCALRDMVAFCMDDNAEVVEKVENRLPAEPKAYGVEYDLERVVLKAGTLKIDVNARGHGTFELDGKPIRGATCLMVEFGVNKNPTLYIESVILDEPTDPVDSIKDEELQREMDRASLRFPADNPDDPLHRLPDGSTGYPARLKDEVETPLFFGGGMMHVAGANTGSCSGPNNSVPLNQTHMFSPGPRYSDPPAILPYPDF